MDVRLFLLTKLATNFKIYLPACVLNLKNTIDRLKMKKYFFLKNLEKGNIWGNNFQKGEFPPQKPQKGNFPRFWGNVAALIQTCMRVMEFLAQ